MGILLDLSVARPECRPAKGLLTSLITDHELRDVSDLKLPYRWEGPDYLSVFLKANLTNLTLLPGDIHVQLVAFFYWYIKVKSTAKFSCLLHNTHDVIQFFLCSVKSKDGSL